MGWRGVVRCTGPLSPNRSVEGASFTEWRRRFAAPPSRGKGPFAPRAVLKGPEHLTTHPRTDPWGDPLLGPL